MSMGETVPTYKASDGTEGWLEPPTEEMVTDEHEKQDAANKAMEEMIRTMEDKVKKGNPAVGPSKSEKPEELQSIVDFFRSIPRKK